MAGCIRVGAAASGQLTVLDRLAQCYGTARREAYLIHLTFPCHPHTAESCQLTAGWAILRNASGFQEGDTIRVEYRGTSGGAQAGLPILRITVQDPGPGGAAGGTAGKAAAAAAAARKPSGAAHRPPAPSKRSRKRRDDSIDSESESESDGEEELPPPAKRNRASQQLQQRRRRPGGNDDGPPVVAGSQRRGQGQGAGAPVTACEQYGLPADVTVSDLVGQRVLLVSPAARSVMLVSAGLAAAPPALLHSPLCLATDPSPTCRHALPAACPAHLPTSHSQRCSDGRQPLWGVGSVRRAVTAPGQQPAAVSVAVEAPCSGAAGTGGGVSGNGAALPPSARPTCCRCRAVLADDGGEHRHQVALADVAAVLPRGPVGWRVHKVCGGSGDATVAAAATDAGVAAASGLYDAHANACLLVPEAPPHSLPALLPSRSSPSRIGPNSSKGGSSSIGRMTTPTK